MFREIDLDPATSPTGHSTAHAAASPHLFRALILDFLFVDFRAGFVDHDHAPTFAVVIEVNGDLTRDQVGGFPGVVLVLAIQSNRIFETDAVGYIKMKNGHGRFSCEINAGKPAVFQNAAT